MIIKEKELNKIIKGDFHLRTILLELDGIVEGHIFFVKAVCKFQYREGILYIFDLINNVRINLVSQYRMIYDEEKKTLLINLDNGQDIKITVIKK